MTPQTGAHCLKFASYWKGHATDGRYFGFFHRKRGFSRDPTPEGVLIRQSRLTIRNLAAQTMPSLALSGHDFHDQSFHAAQSTIPASVAEAGRPKRQQKSFGPFEFVQNRHQDVLIYRLGNMRVKPCFGGFGDV